LATFKLNSALSPTATFRVIAVSVVLVTAMAAVRLWLDPVLGDHDSFILFLAAVFLADWYGGWRVGVPALVLGLLITSYLFINPHWSFGPLRVEQQIGVLVYAVVGVASILLIESLRKEKRRAEMHARQLQAEIARHQKTYETLCNARAELEGGLQHGTARLAETAGQLRSESTARQEAEKSLARLAALVASSEDGIIGLDLDGVITDWNVGAEHLFGCSAAAAVGRDIFFVIPEQDRQQASATLARIRQGEQVLPYEASRVRNDGSKVVVSVRISPIFEHGRVNGISLIYRDLTQSRQLEAQFQQAQKMEAVGQLAGGVAHDFNNLLTIISGYCEILLADRTLNETARGPLEEICRAGTRAAGLTRQLLAFSRKQVLEPKVIDLNDTVTDAERMLRRLIGEDVQLTVRLARELGHVKADPGQVEQILMNLAINARDAMPRGGRLTIETANVELDAAYAERTPDIWAGRFVLLAVTDTGTGMDEKTRSRVFEPFFTTKPIGQGTGLGLAVVHGIVKQSGGHVAVYSETDHGTVFKIYLPAVENLRSVKQSRQDGTLGKGNETILLVEDEAAVRSIARCALQAAGYNVLEAGHGGEAVSPFGEGKGAFCADVRAQG
jgi:PAS domain S-box-containing protein